MPPRRAPSSIRRPATWSSCSPMASSATRPRSRPPPTGRAADSVPGHQELRHRQHHHHAQRGGPGQRRRDVHHPGNGRPGRHDAELRAAAVRRSASSATPPARSARSCVRVAAWRRGHLHGDHRQLPRRAPSSSTPATWSPSPMASATRPRSRPPPTAWAPDSGPATKNFVTASITITPNAAWTRGQRRRDVHHPGDGRPGRHDAELQPLPTVSFPCRHAGLGRPGSRSCRQVGDVATYTRDHRRQHAGHLRHRRQRRGHLHRWLRRTRPRSRPPPTAWAPTAARPPRISSPPASPSRPTRWTRSTTPRRSPSR